MLEELKEEEIVNKVGGRFKLSTLIQKRLVQLNQGSRALVNVDTHDTGRGVAVEDFDRDGYLDIVTGGSFHDVKFYRNDRGITFVDQTELVGLGGVKQPFFINRLDMIYFPGK